MVVHVEDIVRFESAVGDDTKKGTWVYLRGEAERRYCSETAKRVRKMIDDEKRKERIELEALTVGLVLKAAVKSGDGRLHFVECDGQLVVMAGDFQTGLLQGKERSDHEHALEQMVEYALVAAESKGAYRLNARGYSLADFIAHSGQSDDLPFDDYVKLPARPSDAKSRIGVQFNQWNNNVENVNNAISEKGDVKQTLD